MPASFDERLCSLQALRFFAAFAVLVSHTLGMYEGISGIGLIPVTQAGVIGVDVFFVISGVIMGKTALFAAQPPTPSAFLARRWWRIAPVYYLLSIPAFLWALRGSEPLWPQAAATVLFWHAGASTVWHPFLDVGWTLCFEMQFYLGVAALLTGRRAVRLLLVVAFVAAWVAFVATGAPLAACLGHPMTLEFLAGIALARWTPRPNILRGFMCLIGAIAAFGFVWATICRTPFWVIFDAPSLYTPTIAHLRVLVFGPAAVVIVWSALQLEPLARRPAAAALIRLGDASYALYLTHMTLLLFFSAHWRTLGWPPAAIIPLEFAAALPLSLIVWERLEKPLHALRRPISKALFAPA